MDDLTELYVMMDDFCKEFEPMLRAQLIADGKRHRNRPVSLSLTKLMTVVVLFHQIRYRQFKLFYIHQGGFRPEESAPALKRGSRESDLRFCGALEGFAWGIVDLGWVTMREGGGAAFTTTPL